MQDIEAGLVHVLCSERDQTRTTLRAPLLIRHVALTIAARAPEIDVRGVCRRDQAVLQLYRAQLDWREEFHAAFS